jgi:DUF1009 family protein
LKEFIEKHVSIGKVDEVTKVLREQQVTNIVAMKKLPRKWLVENLGEDAARDILTASVDEQVIHPQRTPHLKDGRLDSRIRPRRCAH